MIQKFLNLNLVQKNVISKSLALSYIIQVNVLFNAKYVPIIENVSKEQNIEFKAIHIDTKEKAQNAPTPITTYALFYNGDYITNDVMNEKKFLKLVEKLK